MVTQICHRLAPCIFLFAVFVCAAGARAQEVASAFIPSEATVTTGEKNSLWLYAMNNSSHEVRTNFAPQLDARFLRPSGATETVLELNSTDAVEAVIPPGGFLKREYFLSVPAILQGQVALDISNYNRVALNIVAPAFTTQATQLPPAAQQPLLLPPRTNQLSRIALVNFFGSRLSPYEPIYFILGTYPAAEFQFSMKFQFFDFTNRLHLLTNSYFAYTQTSYWDLLSSDPSFFDTSYKPSLFEYFPGIVSTRNKTFQLDLQGGAEHESNGRGGSGERSIYTAYLQPTFIFGKPGHLQFALQPRAWTYFLVGHNNPDIATYRGYADLRAFLTLKKAPNSWENFQVETRLRLGDGGSHAGYQINLRYKFPHFGPALQVQYFEGYGQTLRQYNQSAHGLRAGFCLWYWPDYPNSADAR